MQMTKMLLLPRIDWLPKKRGKQEIGLNAGHDLDLENLKFFKQSLPNLLEVSIGHALVCDALYLGLHNTIVAYLNQLK